jgi:hypothetical protein
MVDPGLRQQRPGRPVTRDRWPGDEDCDLDFRLLECWRIVHQAAPDIAGEEFHALLHEYQEALFDLVEAYADDPEGLSFYFRSLRIEEAEELREKEERLAREDARQWAADHDIDLT